jgi:lysophospholipase L1-like esterase
MRFDLRRALALVLLCANAAHAADCRGTWVGAWGFPATPAFPAHASADKPAQRDSLRAPVPNFDHATVRQIVRLAAAATCVRIRISNEFGAGPLRIGALHIARAAQDGGILPDSDHVLTFSGNTSITIPPGAPALSDPIAWNVRALSRLAISAYLPERTRPPGHRVFEYVAPAGNFSASRRMPGAQWLLTGALSTQVQIISPTAKRAIVTLGDSITEGFGSTPNAFRGWADRLAERLQRSPNTDGWSVVDAGVNSNRLLHNGPGIGALARFDRDVLSVPGVAMIILLEGINDIGYSHTRPAEAVTAQDIIVAYRQLIARAHAHGIKIVAGTLMAFEGAHYYTAQGEMTRQTVNRWIRTSGAFDGIIDFDAALRDPSHPLRINPALQRGDDLHPNDAGYEAMARAISLGLFAGRAASATSSLSRAGAPATPWRDGTLRLDRPR